MSSLYVSGSYVQSNRHAMVSERFNPIQAASVGQAMTNHGLNLVSLSTGKARHEDKIDFQRTLSRYRGPSIGEGVNLDIVYDSKHMGRGVDRILLGIYRLVCTNGLFVGKNFFSFDVRHAGDTYLNLNRGIDAALEISAKLGDTVKKMQSIQLDDAQRFAFAKEVTALLIPSEGVMDVRERLLKPNREIDKANDLWTVYNVVQENAVRGGNLVYSKRTKDPMTGIETVRRMTQRAIKPNTGKDATFNQALFDIALKIAA